MGKLKQKSSNSKVKNVKDSSAKTGSSTSNLTSSKNSKITNQNKFAKKQSSTKNNSKIKSLKPSGIGDINWSKLGATAMDVVDNAINIVDNPVKGVLDLPNTILKVVDTASSTISDLSKSNSLPDKVVALSQDDINKKQNQKVLSELSRTQPFITTSLIPSGYSSDITTGQPVAEERFNRVLNRNVMNYRFATKCNFLANYDALLATTVNRGTSTAITPLISAMVGPRMFTIAGLYQRYRINRVTFQWIPNQTTSQNGMTIFSILQGTNNLGGPFNLNTISQREFYKASSAYKAFSLTYPGDNVNYYVTNPGGAEPLKFFHGAIFEVYNVGNTGPLVPYPGDIYASFDIDLWAQIEVPLSFSLSNRFSDQVYRVYIQYGLGQPSYKIYLKYMIAYLNSILKSYQETFEETESDSYQVTISSKRSLLSIQKYPSILKPKESYKVLSFSQDLNLYIDYCNTETSFYLKYSPQFNVKLCCDELIQFVATTIEEQNFLFETEVDDHKVIEFCKAGIRNLLHIIEEDFEIVIDIDSDPETDKD